MDVRVIRHTRYFEPLHSFQSFPVVIGQIPPTVVQFLQPGQLSKTEGSLNIGKVVFESRCYDVIVGISPLAVPLPCIPFNSMKAEKPQPAFEVAMTVRNHAAFAGCDVLDRMK